MKGRAPAHDTPATDHSGQRLDKWLWCARIFRTRALAQAFAKKGAVRLTRDGSVMRIEKAHVLVRPGDRLSFMASGRLRVLDILRCADRRGPAEEAQALYRERTHAQAAARLRTVQRKLSDFLR